jgi:hypothetical protein
MAFVGPDDNKPVAPRPTGVAASTSSAPPGTTTGTSGPTAGAPVPGAAVYGARQADAERIYGHSMDQLQDRQNRLYSEFGMTQSGDIDPNSVFGRYQQTLQSQAGQSLDFEESAAMRGFGAGSGQAGIHRLKYGQGLEQFQLKADLANQLSDINNQRTNAADTKGTSMTNALAESVNTGLATQNFTPAAPPDATPAAVAGGLSWGGQHFTTKAALAKYLASRGQSFAAWSRNHQAALGSLT